MSIRGWPLPGCAVVPCVGLRHPKGTFPFKYSSIRDYWTCRDKSGDDFLYFTTSQSTGLDTEFDRGI
jgi:hypothetical protein